MDKDQVDFRNETVLMKFVLILSYPSSRRCTLFLHILIRMGCCSRVIIYLEMCLQNKTGSTFCYLKSLISSVFCSVLSLKQVSKQGPNVGISFLLIH